MLELIIWFSRRSSSRGLPSNATIYTTSPSLDEDQPSVWLDGDLFYLPSDFFCSTLLYSIHFSPPVTICFKNRTFLLPLSRELHAEMQLRFFVCFVFCLTSVESKHQSNEYNQAGANDFQCLFGHFEYVGYLLHTIAIFFRLSLFNPV